MLESRASTLPASGRLQPSQRRIVVGKREVPDFCRREVIGKGLGHARGGAICHQRHSFDFSMVVPNEADVRDKACRSFGSVLSPDYNAAHADHLHLDMAPWMMCR